MLRRILRICALGTAALVACSRDVTGPVGATRSFALAPQFPRLFDQMPDAFALAPFSSVRAALVSSSGTPVADTTVAFPASADSVALQLDVPESASGEPLRALVWCINAAGDTVFKGGPVSVDPRESATDVPLTYSGAGATASQLRITPRVDTIAAGGSFRFTASALDASGSAISGAPIVYRVLNTSLAQLPSDTSGAGSSLSATGSTPIVAQAITGLADTAMLVVVPADSGAGGGGGGGTGGAIATALAIVTQPVTTVAGTALTLTVDALDATGKIVTTFTGPIVLALGSNSGGGTLGGTLTGTAVNGVATFANVLLTKAASAYTLVASSSGLTAATSQAFNINPGAPSAIAIAGGNNQSGLLSALLGAPLSVVVHDAFGNATPGVNVAWAVASGGGALASSTTQTNSSGIATDGWTLGSVLGTQTATATASGVSGATTFTASALANVVAVAKLVLSAIPSTVTAGAAIAQTITVTAVDAAGSVVSSFTGALQLALGANPAGGALSGTTSANAVSGVATFTGVLLTKAASGYTLVGSGDGLTSSASSAFAVVPGAPASITKQGGDNQSGLLSALLGSPLSVLVQDPYGNATPGVNVAWAVASGGGALSSSTTQTNSSGIATDGWTLGSLLGSQTATAAASGVASAVTFTASALGGAATKLVMSAIGSTVTAGSAIAQSITVTAEDASGNVVSSFSGPVQLALGSNPGGGSLGGTTSANAVNGVATFTGVLLTKAASGYTVVASGDGLASPASSAFSVVPGAPASITKQGGDGQSGILGALLANPLSVLVTDAFGNPVSGATVSWVVSAGNASLGSSSSTTNSSGVATNALTLLGLLPGLSQVTASLGTVGSVVFSATSIL
jgi:hypothetical protein